MMKVLICLFIFQSFFHLSFCQTKTAKPSASDSISKIIKLLPEYKAEQKRIDSIAAQDTASSGQFGVSVTIAVSDESKIADVIITEELNNVQKLAYLIKYDIQLKKIISIKKQY